MAAQGIRSTKTYIWYLKDVLGTGATSSVYLGRHKKSGDVVAVKMFNHMSYMRPQDVQKREFEVLLKLKHKNIIFLHTIEDDQISKQPVIVMELCTGGSLYSHLDTPENLYGLKEKEFICVLRDVSAGMKHLRDKGIIHRDIKPGNIMMVRDEDGVFVYKLADFGAARELDDEEAFTSLYGTEEYLHPDVYERAVLGKRNRTAQFTAQTDLWSLGVTFYHTATGSLPFRAHGGRSNRDVMHKITTTKQSGILSGVQETVNGPIIWSEELPKTCHLSPDMRLMVKSLLANTMECNMTKMWTFEKFFEFVQVITALRAVDVFVAPTCECHKVYVEQNRGATDFQAKIAHLTGIQPDTQCLMWEKEVLDVRKCFKCEDLPHTTPDKPLILLRLEAEVFPGIKPHTLPTQPKTATHYSVQQDSSLAKNCCAVMCYYEVMVEKFTRIETLITDTVKSVIIVLRMDYQKLRSTHSGVMAHFYQVDCKLKSLERMCLMVVMIGLDEEMSAKMDTLKQQLSVWTNRAVELNKSLDLVTMALDMVEKTAISDDYLSSQWEGIRQQLVLPKERIGRLKVVSEEGRQTYTRFKKDKQNKQLSYNEEQIHRMDKDKLAKKMQLAKKIFDDLFDILRKLHNQFGMWHGPGSETRKFQDQLHSAESRLTELPYEYQKVINELSKIEDECTGLIQRRSGMVSSSANQQPASREVETAEVMTSITPSISQTSGFSRMRFSRPTTSDSLLSSVQQLIYDLPLESLGMVPVPKSVRQTLQHYETSLNSLQQQLHGDNGLSRSYADNRVP